MSTFLIHYYLFSYFSHFCHWILPFKSPCQFDISCLERKKTSDVTLYEMKIVKCREETQTWWSEAGIFIAGLTNDYCCPNVAKELTLDFTFCKGLLKGTEQRSVHDRDHMWPTTLNNYQLALHRGLPPVLFSGSSSPGPCFGNSAKCPGVNKAQDWDSTEQLTTVSTPQPQTQQHQLKTLEASTDTPSYLVDFYAYLSLILHTLDDVICVHKLLLQTWWSKQKWAIFFPLSGWAMLHCSCLMLFFVFLKNSLHWFFSTFQI